MPKRTMSSLYIVMKTRPRKTGGKIQEVLKDKISRSEEVSIESLDTLEKNWSDIERALKETTNKELIKYLLHYASTPGFSNKNLYGAMTLLSNLDPIKPHRIDAIMKNIDRMHPDSLPDLASIIQLMQKAGIHLANKNSRNLEKLMGKNFNAIKGFSLVINAMKPLNDERFNALLDVIDSGFPATETVKRSNKKAENLAKCIGTMQEKNTSLRKYMKDLMGLSYRELDGFNTALNSMSTVSDARLKVLFDNKQILMYREETEAVSNFINLLDSKVPLTQKETHVLDDFMKLKNIDQREGVVTVLRHMGGKINSSRVAALLNAAPRFFVAEKNDEPAENFRQKPDNNVINKTAEKNIQLKTAVLCDCIDSLQEAGVPLSDKHATLKSLMSLETLDELKSVNRLLGFMKPITAEDVKTLTDITHINAHILKKDTLLDEPEATSELDNRIESLGKIITMLQDNKVSLTKNDNLKRVMITNPKVIDGIEQVFAAMNSLSQDRFNAVINVTDSVFVADTGVAASEQEDNINQKTKAIVSCIKMFEKNKVPLADKHSRLNTFLTTVDSLEKLEKFEHLLNILDPVTGDRIDVLLRSTDNLSDKDKFDTSYLTDEDKYNDIINYIELIQNSKSGLLASKVPLTKDNNLSDFMSLDSKQRETMLGFLSIASPEISKALHQEMKTHLDFLTKHDEHKAKISDCLEMMKDNMKLEKNLSTLVEHAKNGSMDTLHNALQILDPVSQDRFNVLSKNIDKVKENSQDIHAIIKIFQAKGIPLTSNNNLQKILNLSNDEISNVTSVIERLNECDAGPGAFNAVMGSIDHIKVQTNAEQMILGINGIHEDEPHKFNENRFLKLINRLFNTSFGVSTSLKDLMKPPKPKDDKMIELTDMSSSKNEDTDDTKHRL